jgi:hypothetical protein
MDYTKIEQEARLLQYELWTRAKNKYPMGVPPLAQIFDPRAAADFLGYSYDIFPDLRRGFLGREEPFEAAGIIDHESQQIFISGRFPYTTQRFTGAHEIGHLRMHPGLRHHRDRPTTGTQTNRPLQEREADYFAACFLAPEKQVRDAFITRFGEPPKALTETLASLLKGAHAHELLNAPTGSLELELAFATATRFGMKQFHSMSTQFGLSHTAMAIRIRELGLVAH